jgi:hypothetical protein
MADALVMFEAVMEGLHAARANVQNGRARLRDIAGNDRMLRWDSAYHPFLGIFPVGSNLGDGIESMLSADGC